MKSLDSTDLSGHHPERPRRRMGSDARRAVIEDAARELFAEQGYQAASLGEIAHRAGITKAVIYDHFPSKEALHLHLLRQQRDALREHVVARLTRSDSAYEGVVDALDAFFSYVETHPYAWRMLFREATGDPVVGEAHRQIQNEAHQAVIGIVLAHPDVKRSLGRLSPDDRQALSFIIGGATHGAARWWWDHKSVSRKKLVRLVMRVVWDGIGPRDP